MPIKNEKNTQILTDGQLRVKGEEKNDIYALGDCATIDNYWLPQTAQIANQQGAHLAKALQLLTDISGNDSYPPFKAADRGALAYLGGPTFSKL